MKTYICNYNKLGKFGEIVTTGSMVTTIFEHDFPFEDQKLLINELQKRFDTLGPEYRLISYCESLPI